MSTARTIKVISITDIGQPFAAPEIGTMAAPALCSVQNAFLFGPYGFVVLPDGTIIQESVLRVDAVRLSQNFDQFKAMFPGEHVLWSHVT